MERAEIKEKYFNWLYSIAYRWETEECDEDFTYKKLARTLFDIPFIVEIPRDENRVTDGINLRYTFGSIRGYEDRVITCCLDDVPCSVFEVMVALARRCETQIMSDPTYGNRTGQWFGEMVKSLGLGSMYNRNFSERRVRDAVDRMLHHEYEPDGTGGLFKIRHPDRDMRGLELWAQMCDHLNEILY